MSKYFETEEAAKLFIQEHYRTGSVQLADLSVQERHVLGLIRRSQDYTADSLLDAWREHQASRKRNGSSRSPSFAKHFTRVRLRKNDHCER